MHGNSRQGSNRSTEKVEQQQHSSGTAEQSRASGCSNSTAAVSSSRSTAQHSTQQAIRPSPPSLAFLSYRHSST